MVSFIQNVMLALLPEVIYFTLFLIFTKQYKNRRILLFFLLLIGYVTLKKIFPFNIYCQIGFIIYVPIILRILYKAKFHLSDMFIIVYASWILILETLLLLPVYLVFNNYIAIFILTRILMIVTVLLLRNKLNKAYKWIISQWNRNYEKPNKVKAITIRQVCVISLNVMIFMLYLGIQYIIK